MNEILVRDLGDAKVETKGEEPDGCDLDGVEPITYWFPNC